MLIFIKWLCKYSRVGHMKLHHCLLLPQFPLLPTTRKQFIFVLLLQAACRATPRVAEKTSALAWSRILFSRIPATLPWFAARGATSRVSWRRADDRRPRGNHGCRRGEEDLMNLAERKRSEMERGGWTTVSFMGRQNDHWSSLTCWTMDQNSLNMWYQKSCFYTGLKDSKCASKGFSALERASKAGSWEQANKWAV